MGKRTSAPRHHGSTAKGKLTARKGVKTKKARTQKPAATIKDKQQTTFHNNVLDDSSAVSNGTNSTRNSNDNDNDNDNQPCRMLDSTFKSADGLNASESSTSGKEIVARIKQRHELCKQKERSIELSKTNDNNESSKDHKSSASDDVSLLSYQQEKQDKNKKKTFVTYA